MRAPPTPVKPTSLKTLMHRWLFQLKRAKAPTESGRFSHRRKHRCVRCPSRHVDGRWLSWPHLCLPELVVHHGEVQAQLLHVAVIALEEKQILVHFRIQGSEVMDVHVSAGSQQLGQEEACKGQLHQHVLVEGLRRAQGAVSSTPQAPFSMFPNTENHVQTDTEWSPKVADTSPQSAEGGGS